MEACSSARFWARYLIARGFEVVLVSPHQVKPYHRRYKTERAGCNDPRGHRRAGFRHVTVKSEAQQARGALHRVRSQWLQSRAARIHAMRGLLPTSASSRWVYPARGRATRYGNSRTAQASFSKCIVTHEARLRRQT
jgi:transposase